MKDTKETREMFKDAGILFAITLLAGLILGLVYQITKEPIAQQKEKAKMEAYQEVFADAASFEEITAISPEDGTAHFYKAGFTAQAMSDTVKKALDEEGQLLGYVMTITSAEGYGGDIVFTMGMKVDGTLNGISLLSISETPGLGMEAEKKLTPQFRNKNVVQFEYTKAGAVGDSQVDALSGATITTKAITNGVNAGLEYFQSVLKGGNL